MKRRYPFTLTVLIDKDEKKKVQFPTAFQWWTRDRCLRRMRLKTSVVKLKTADYALRGYEDIVLVERKGTWPEINHNLLSTDRRRFVNVMDRMATETLHPTFLIEMARSDAFRAVPGYLLEPRCTLDYFFREAIRRRIHVLWWPPPGAASPYQGGEMIVRWMWQCVYSHLYMEPYHDPQQRGNPRHRTRPRQPRRLVPALDSR